MTNEQLPLSILPILAMQNPHLLPFQLLKIDHNQMLHPPQIY